MRTVKWKRTAITIGLTLTLLLSSVPLSLLQSPRAGAISSVYNDLPLADKAKFYAYFYLMQTCFRDSAIETNAAKVAAGKLFYDKRGVPDVVGTLRSFVVGGVGFVADGVSTCGETDSEFSTLALTGLGVNAIDMVCAMGYTRQNQGGGTACTQGTNDFNDGGGITDGPTRVNKFVAYIQAQTGFTAAAATSDGSEFMYDKLTLVNACTTGTVVGSLTGTPADMQYKVAALSTDGTDTSELYLGKGDHNYNWKVNDLDTGRTCGQILSNLQYGTKEFKDYKNAVTKASIVKGCTDHGYKDIPGGSFPGSSELSACIGGGQNKTSPIYCATTWKDTTYKTTPVSRQIERDACAYGQTGKFTIVDGTIPPGDNASSSKCAIPSVGWLVCPTFAFFGSLADGMYGAISGLLQTSPTTFDTSSGTYAGWQIMRNFANVGFVIVFLIIIFSQISNIGITSYGVKKLLPRLVVAAIIVNISYFICQIGVDLSNILGKSLKDLMDGLPVFSSSLQGDVLATGTFWTDLVVNIQGGTGIVDIFAAAGALAVFGGIGLMLPIVLAAVLAIAVTLLILIARQALIILLVVIAPLAFLAMLLPNTESLFKQWRKIFVALLLVYPAIALLFGASRVAAGILAPTLGNLGAAVAIVVPLLATPILLRNSLNAIPALGTLAKRWQMRANGNVAKSAKKRYDQSRLGQFQKYWKGERDLKRAQRQSGSYTGNGRLARLSSRNNAFLNSITGKFGERATAQGAALANSEDAELLKNAGSRVSALSYVDKATGLNRKLDTKQLIQIGRGSNVTTGGIDRDGEDVGDILFTSSMFDSHARRASMTEAGRRANVEETGLMMNATGTMTDALEREDTAAAMRSSQGAVYAPFLGGAEADKAAKRGSSTNNAAIGSILSNKIGAKELAIGNADSTAMLVDAVRTMPTRTDEEKDLKKQATDKLKLAYASLKTTKDATLSSKVDKGSEFDKALQRIDTDI